MRPYLKTSRFDDKALSSLASQCLAKLRKEGTIDPKWSVKYAQSYAREARKLGHYCEVLLVSAQEYHDQQRRVAMNAHAGACKHLSSVSPFCEEAFLEKCPLPAADAPRRAVGFAFTPSYMLADAARKKSAWQAQHAMDVGGPRGTSPFSLFMITILDADHHMHQIQSVSLADGESDKAWYRLIQRAVVNFPAMDRKGSRTVADDHKGSRKALLRATRHTVPFSCGVHLAKRIAKETLWGGVAERDRAVKLYKKGLRIGDAKTVRTMLREHAEDPLGNAISAAKFASLPLECIFPALRTFPTHFKTRGPIGPMDGNVCGNFVESWMKMAVRPRPKPRTLA